MQRCHTALPSCPQSDRRGPLPLSLHNCIRKSKHRGTPAKRCRSPPFVTASVLPPAHSVHLETPPEEGSLSESILIRSSIKFITVTANRYLLQVAINPPRPPTLPMRTNPRAEIQSEGTQQTDRTIRKLTSSQGVKPRGTPERSQRTHSSSPRRPPSAGNTCSSRRRLSPTEGLRNFVGKNRSRNVGARRVASRRRVFRPPLEGGGGGGERARGRRGVGAVGIAGQGRSGASVGVRAVHAHVSSSASRRIDAGNSSSRRRESTR